MFFFILTYKKPLTEVEKFLDNHNEYLDKFYKEGKFIFSGRKNPRTGGVILCNADNLEEAKNIYYNDPFYKNGIANYDVIEFQPTKFNNTFEQLINKI